MREQSIKYKLAVARRRRRHHNNDGRTQLKRGKTAEQVDRMAKKILKGGEKHGD